MSSKIHAEARLVARARAGTAEAGKQANARWMSPKVLKQYDRGCTMEMKCHCCLSQNRKEALRGLGQRVSS